MRYLYPSIVLTIFIVVFSSCKQDGTQPNIVVILCDDLGYGESITFLIETGNKQRMKPLTRAFYNALNEHVLVMRTDDWKIMCRLKDDAIDLPKIYNLYNGNEALVKKAELADFVLFNMKNDIGEREDLPEKYPEAFEKMKNMLASEYAELLDDSHIWKREAENNLAGNNESL